MSCLENTISVNIKYSRVTIDHLRNVLAKVLTMYHELLYLSEEIFAYELD